MIASISISDKSYGDKILYEDLSLSLNAYEKVGLIGRNGMGKTTLFHILTGDDTDFGGKVEFKKGLITISSRQEHHGHEHKPVLEYILSDLPEYAELKHIIDTYPEHMGDNMKKLESYSEAIERFSSLGYYMVEEEIFRTLQAYQLNEEQIRGRLDQLSGGQKRFIELAKVQHARADLALIDEPTNHMDYLAKEVFLDWFKGAREAVVVITHDRDVLRHVDRIVEIRDGKAFSFKGNYDDYLRTNATKIVSEVHEYNVAQRRIKNLTEDVTRFRRMKEKARDPGTISRFKSLEIRSVTELEKLQELEKPSFWIDRESVGNLNEKMTEAYEEHKARNIRVRTKTKETKSSSLLIEASKVSLGYTETPLFADVSFQLREGDRLRLHGRNGAGKTTLVKTILAKALEQEPIARVFGGTIAVAKELKIGVYEQEIAPKYLELTLHDAIEQAFMARDIPVNDQKISQLLGDYLFHPASDGAMLLSRLSGGQKARFQMMQMLMDDPAVLILDEPTNHLDLPSIEELEEALMQYHGAILYISHDSYFVQKMGGEVVGIGHDNSKR
ncbi:MAG: ATPase component of transporter with duplicated ATPase protein [Candidatus Saccharibacteria bacterium]|nr:ATPase component of transporter with duplicated ATPase protein [Candidatus Saccharibacteria bacterium]